MASTYSDLLRLEIQTTGENNATWGTKANTVFEMLEDSIASVTTVSLSDANYTLTTANGTADEARSMVLELTGALTASRNVVCPTSDKLYVVYNNTSGGQSVVFKTTAGTGVTIPNGKKVLLYCDATNVVDAISIQRMSAQYRLLGRSSASAGPTEEVTATASAFNSLGLPNQAAQYGGRLTLTSATPVTSADVTGAAGATLVYYTPSNGNLIDIYDGTQFVQTIFTELTLTMDSDSGHTGYHQIDNNYDLFVFNDSGTIRLGTGPKWTSATARADAITMLLGRYVNNATITLRFGNSSGNTVSVAANRATYVGTVRTFEDGRSADTRAKRFLWNYANRAPRAIRVIDTTDSWNYSTASYRQANNSTNNQFAMVRGLDEDAVSVDVVAMVANSTATGRQVFSGIGVDSTSTQGATVSTQGIAIPFATGIQPCAKYAGFPGLGYHYLAWLEKGNGTDTQTWYGDNGSTDIQTGMIGICFA